MTRMLNKTGPLHAAQRAIVAKAVTEQGKARAAKFLDVAERTLYDWGHELSLKRFEPPEWLAADSHVAIHYLASGPLRRYEDALVSEIDRRNRSMELAIRIAVDALMQADGRKALRVLMQHSGVTAEVPPPGRGLE